MVFRTYFAACLYAVISPQWLEYDENFTPGVKSPGDSKYDVRIDVLDPQTRQPLIMLYQKQT